EPVLAKHAARGQRGAQSGLFQHVLKELRIGGHRLLLSGRPASRRAAQVAPSLALDLLDGEPFPAGASLTARRQGTERRVDSVRGVLVAGGLGRLELLAQLGFELGRDLGVLAQVLARVVLALADALGAVAV